MEGRFTTTYGWNLRIVEHIPQMLRDIGFVNVEERRNLVPLGRWPSEPRRREMGIFNQTVSEYWLAAVLANHEALGLDEGQADKLANDLADALNDSRIHAHIAYAESRAQKPWS
jgi:hypothetical protein